MVDAVVSVFLEKLVNALEEETRILNEYRDQFEKLQSELQLMQCFLKDAERRKRKNQTLRKIMIDLRELIYEAEDILADCQPHYEDAIKHSNAFLLCFSPEKIPFQHRSSKRLVAINAKVNNTKQDISSYLGVRLLTEPEPQDAQQHQMSRWSSPIYDHTRVVGLEADNRKIKDWLFNASNGLLSIGIVGMGGVGKTTAAQTVFNDREVEEWFERRIWVCVSQTFTEEQVMRSMLRNLGDVSLGDDRAELLKKINHYLQGKRYLIVMDDVWSNDNSWWLRIYEGLPKGNGSSIIITTRIVEVVQKMGVAEARTHRPKCLDKDDSWLLFCKIAFAATEGECSNQELETVGKEIVDKCKGLPLAIKAVGGLMLCKPQYYHEWRSIANHFQDELAENDDSVTASLRLSYDELPPYLKSCFLCFSVYPEDCIISKEQLVYWWVGEGFVPLRNGRSSIEAGEYCFSGLTNRCLIEVVDRSYNGTINSCKIHDMVRDLAIGIAKDDAFAGSETKHSRHLALKNDMDHKHFGGNQKLRALLSTTKGGEINKIHPSTGRLFSDCTYMRVCDLSKTVFYLPVTGLLNQISSLQHLTYINLSNTNPLIQVPSSLEKLKDLQILVFSYCQDLKMLPSCITTLKKLVVLDVSYCGSLDYLPKGLGNLSNLQVLLGFRPARTGQVQGCRIAELRMLTQLTKLKLQLTCGEQILDEEVNVLEHLQNLQILTVSCFDSRGTDLVMKLEKLLPPKQLHELCLRYYPGEISPTWLNPVSLPMLRYLTISSGNLTKMHQSFWGGNGSIWKIEGLLLESLSYLDEKWAVVQQAMPSLKTACVRWCPELESFPVDDAGFKGGVWKKEEHRNQNH